MLCLTLIIQRFVGDQKIVIILNGRSVGGLNFLQKKAKEKTLLLLDFLKVELDFMIRD